MRERGFVAALTVGILLGWVGRGAVAPAVARAPDPADTMTRVMGDIASRYPGPPDQKVLLYAAIRGAMAPLDRWTRYYPPDEVAMLTLDPPDLGIGVDTVADACGLRVTAVADPEARAGLVVGDCIRTIDGVALAALPEEQRAGRMLGKERTGAVLEVDRAVPGAPELVAVWRPWRNGAPLEEQLWPLPTQVTLLKVRRFAPGVNDLWAGGPAEGGLVVDLRGNAGGDMIEAVRMAERFVTSGVILTAEVRSELPRTYLGHDEGSEFKGPVVVLVDEGTASAAEILAGALQARVGARVVGRPTVGKRSIQTVLWYEDGSAMQLTIGHFELPGTDIRIDSPVPLGTEEAGWLQAANAALLPSPPG